MERTRVRVRDEKRSGLWSALNAYYAKNGVPIEVEETADGTYLYVPTDELDWWMVNFVAG
jgi:hypothetical protein